KHIRATVLLLSSVNFGPDFTRHRSPYQAGKSAAAARFLSPAASQWACGALQSRGSGVAAQGCGGPLNCLPSQASETASGIDAMGKSLGEGLAAQRGQRTYFLYIPWSGALGWRMRMQKKHVPWRRRSSGRNREQAAQEFSYRCAPSVCSGSIQPACPQLPRPSERACVRTAQRMSSGGLYNTAWGIRSHLSLWPLFAPCCSFCSYQSAASSSSSATPPLARVIAESLAPPQQPPPRPPTPLSCQFLSPESRRVSKDLLPSRLRHSLQRGLRRIRSAQTCRLMLLLKLGDSCVRRPSDQSVTHVSPGQPCSDSNSLAAAPRRRVAAASAQYAEQLRQMMFGLGDLPEPCGGSLDLVRIFSPAASPLGCAAAVAAHERGTARMRRRCQRRTWCGPPLQQAGAERTASATDRPAGRERAACRLENGGDGLRRPLRSTDLSWLSAGRGADLRPQPQRLPPFLESWPLPEAGGRPGAAAGGAAAALQRLNRARRASAPQTTHPPLLPCRSRRGPPAARICALPQLAGPGRHSLSSPRLPAAQFLAHQAVPELLDTVKLRAAETWPSEALLLEARSALRC
uniref:Protein kinase domain-containing protein n=1 Tax=Macrostomum lignano TaxID=282301 RepID=A0A1I8FGU6_9PLAT